MKQNSDGTYTVSFLLIPEYAMVALLSAIEPLRVANRMAKKQIFKWEILIEGDDPVSASNELSLVQGKKISNDYIPNTVFVCSSFNPEQHINESTVQWLKLVSRQGSCIGAMDTGCYLLAKANLIKDRLVTLHWEAAPAFQEDYPQIEISNEIFEIDQNLLTCAGGTSALDMMLFLIQKKLGRDVALKVCDQFIKKGIRQKSAKQRIDLASRLNLHHPRLLKVIALMEENIEDPLTANELAEQSHISMRQLQRLFKTHFDTSPSCYYLKIRLERAQQLLKESQLSISEIGIACGFNSAPHFTTCYKNQYNLSPSEERNANMEFYEDSE
jgi:AraC family carnitine catabolism transcriptional activator